MPLNTLRLNHAPSSHPNDRVVFIKPLKRPPERRHEYERAEEILKAVAAQALPIMKEHHLSVTTLEEHEPNREFVGRNWNHGETIELCLQSLSGAWLPLRMIEGVFMHELAHCTVMSHSHAFWKLRNKYCDTLRGLWARGYTGDGFWSAGRVIGELEQDMTGQIAPTEEVQDLEVCGGTFKSRRKKRKAKQELSWKEKQDRRIEKKFGKNGEALGADEDKALTLAIKTKGPLGTKPRVAQSKRGRDLRAAAALARFSTNKKEVEEIEGFKQSETETESEEEYEEADDGQGDAVDSNGRAILDAKGQPVVRASDEDKGSIDDRRQEREDLADFISINPAFSKTKTDGRTDETPTSQTSAVENTLSEPLQSHPTAAERTNVVSTSSSPIPRKDTAVPLVQNLHNGDDPASVSCPICSMTNKAVQPTCVACAHVLDSRRDARAWACHSETCKGSMYRNSGDVAICGVCGTRKQALGSTQATLSPRSSLRVSFDNAYQ